MLKKILSLLLLVLASMPLMAAEDVTPDEITLFKQTPQRELTLHIFYPDDQKEGVDRTAIISFFGGGWVAGSPEQFYGQSEYFASLGMVAISADYRLIGQDGTTPFESVMDAKSAVRWVRENCKSLGINPSRIVTAGGSAGGHLAVSTALIEGCEDDADLSVSSVPNAMILFNPVVKTTSDGYGADKLVGQETELSPVHHVRKNLPPTLIMHGTQDTTVPFQNAVEFTEKMVACGNQCTLIPAFGENHGFFNGTFRPTFGMRNYKRCMSASAEFLSDLGFIESGDFSSEPVRVACVGNSITFGSRIENRDVDSYPAQLQNLLGEDYQVKNFGRSGATLLRDGNVPYTSTDEYKELLEYKPDVIIIKLGTNDSKAGNWKHKDKFEEDYAALLKSLKSTGYRLPQIYVCSPMPAFTPNSSTSINDSIIKNQVYPAVKSAAKKNRVTFIDLYKPFEDMKALFPDNIHPNAAGAKRLAKIIYGEISQTTAAIESDDVDEMVDLAGLLPSSAYHTMRGGLKNSQAIFNTTKKGTIAFLGGSITANPGWRDMVKDYFERKFPETQFTFIDAGIPSEGTTSGAMRIERDILSKGKVDLLFEEAAVNDRSKELRCDSDDRVRGMEGLVRRAREANPEMDIVIMNFVDPAKMVDYNNGVTPQEILDFDLIANQYDIPTINLAKEVTDRINAREFTWKSDFINLHPSPFGQKVYYRTIYHFLEQAYADSQGVTKTVEYPMPTMVDKFAYDRGEYIDISEAKLGKGWSLDQSWKPKNDEKYRKGYVEIPRPAIVAEDESGYLTFKFEGRAVGIMVMSGLDAGVVEYTIDGKKYDPIDLFTSNSPFQHLARYFMMDNELDGKKKHTLKIRLAETANEKSTGNACRIISFVVNK
ncbi:MAG: GDSL-type esterase/lipase family protein [Rikenellaceae bacterium]